MTFLENPKQHTKSFCMSGRTAWWCWCLGTRPQAPTDARSASRSHSTLSAARRMSPLWVGEHGNIFIDNLLKLFSSTSICSNHRRWEGLLQWGEYPCILWLSLIGPEASMKLSHWPYLRPVSFNCEKIRKNTLCKNRKCIYAAGAKYPLQ